MRNSLHHRREMIDIRRANGDGSIIKLSGNRRRPYTIRRVVGWREDGGRIIKYQGYYRTRREAEAALNEYNNDPYTISKKTFDDVYKEWYAIQEQTRRDNTLKGYRIDYGHLAPLHDMRIKDIDRSDLQKLYNKADVSQNTLRKMMQLINMIFAYAVKCNILPISALNINKTINVPLKESKKQKSREILSDDDIRILWKNKDNDYARIALVYVYTGMRFSELQGLTPDRCHDNYVEIVDAKTPAGNRIVPLSDKVRSLLPIIEVPSRTTFERHFKYFLPDHYIHETRHTFISMLVKAGVDDRIIKAIVGHKTNDITEVYTHIPLDVMLEAVNKI